MDRKGMWKSYFVYKFHNTIYGVFELIRKSKTINA